VFDEDEDVGKDIESPKNADTHLASQKQYLGATTAGVQEEIEGHRSATDNHHPGVTDDKVRGRCHQWYPDLTLRTRRKRNEAKNFRR
jgi:hypothetical protein